MTTTVLPINGVAETSPGSAVRRVDQFAPGGPAADQPVVTLDGGNGPAPCVVLARHDADLIEVWREGTLTVLHGEVPASAIVAAHDRETALLAAIATVTRLRRDAQTSLGRANARHHTTIEEMRAYAIEQHEDRMICRDGLEEFLDHFDLEPYEQRLRVTFTLTGSYEVESTNRDHTWSDAQYVRIDLGGVDNTVSEPDTHSVEVLSIDPAED